MVNWLNIKFAKGLCAYGSELSPVYTGSVFL